LSLISAVSKRKNKFLGNNTRTITPHLQYKMEAKRKMKGLAHCKHVRESYSRMI
jgi:hypothetical protein